MLKRLLFSLVLAIFASALFAWVMVWQYFGTLFPSSEVNSVHVSDAPREVFGGFFVIGLFPLGLIAL